MKTGYKTLITLTEILNNSSKTTNTILKEGKENFSKNDIWLADIEQLQNFECEE